MGNGMGEEGKRSAYSRDSYQYRLAGRRRDSHSRLLRLQRKWEVKAKTTSIAKVSSGLT